MYSRLAELRRFELPIYIALSWRRTAQHDELMEIALRQRPEYARAHHPDGVRSVETMLGIDRVRRHGSAPHG